MSKEIAEYGIFKYCLFMHTQKEDYVLPIGMFSGIGWLSFLFSSMELSEDITWTLVEK